MGYTTGTVGVFLYAILLFIPVKHGHSPTPETTYSAASYLFGNGLAAEQFFQWTGVIFLFLAVVHATHRDNVLLLWIVAGGTQFVLSGVLPLYLRLPAEPAVATLFELLSLGTGVFPVSATVGLAATLLTLARIRHSGFSLSALVSRGDAEPNAGWIRSTRTVSHWLLLSRVAGYTVSATTAGTAVFWIADASTVTLSPPSPRVGEAAGLLFLALFVFDLVRTRSTRLLTLFAVVSAVTGLAGLQYGTRTPHALIAAGVLLFVSVLASLIYRRRTSPSAENDSHSSEQTQGQ
ncbi:MAG: hypothetical protein ABEH80_05065 [Halobaculum sp.]